MSEYMGLHNQWQSRPSDERFLSLIDLHAHCESQHKNSSAKVLPNRALKVVPIENDAKHEGLQIVGPNGGSVELTHHSFNQVAKFASAPPSFLRELPSELAADCLNWGLHYKRSVEEMGVLLTKQDDIAILRCATGPGYGRIWK
jgi:hypothetical protein